MRIDTLNVNGFRGNEKSVYDEIDAEELYANLRCLKAFVDERMREEHSVMILQEIPHEILDKRTQRWKWCENELHRAFIDLFSDQYKIILPKHLIHSYQCSAAICKKDSLWKQIDQELLVYDAKYSFGNKVVELQYQDRISLLGLHMNPSEAMWNLLFQTYRQGNKHTFIAGDFNAYEQRGTMKDKPQRLRSFGYCPIIPSNVITEYNDESSIDNIYMDKDLKISSEVSIHVCKSKPFESDHALCAMELDL